MDCMEVKGESPVEVQLEPLLILEDGDEPGEFTTNVHGVLRMRKAEEDSGGIKWRVKGNADAEPDTGGSRSMCRDAELNEEEVGDQPRQREEKLEANEEEVGDQPRQREEKLEGEAKSERAVEAVETSAGSLLEASVETAAQPGAGPAEWEKSGEKEEQTSQQTVVAAEEAAPLPPHAQSPVKLRRRDFLMPEDPRQKAHRLSHDFPDTLYELLCALQEGRRLNDQRCSFQLQGRRRCHSEPATPRHSQKVVFSSMTSLQKEEFFELVATSQARRLDDQRAELQKLPPVLLPTDSRRPSSSFKAKARKGSCKPPAAPQAAPTPPPKEELYNMIVISQAQGRLEEQRSRAPGPMDDDDFFSLLLKVQGGRMDEQRTELPIALKY